MEFLSRPDDKKPRWIITDGNPDPKLIEEKAQDTSNSTDTEKGKPVAWSFISYHCQCNIGNIGKAVTQMKGV